MFLMLAPSFTKGAVYSTKLSIGKTYQWYIKMEQATTLNIDISHAISKNLMLQAQITDRRTEPVNPTKFTDIKIAPSFVGSEEVFAEYWNNNILNDALINKQFYVFGILFIPLQYTDSETYLEYLERRDFEVTITTSNSIITYNEYTLTYDNKGVLESYVKNVGGFLVTIERTMSIAGIVGLSVGGIVVLISVIAVTIIVIIIRRRRREVTTTYQFPDYIEQDPTYQKQQKTSYVGAVAQHQQVPMGVSPGRAAGFRLRSQPSFSLVYLEAIFGIIALLLIFSNDLIIKTSFKMNLNDFIFNSNWVYNENNFFNIIFDTNALAIILFAITLILAILIPVDMEEREFPFRIALKIGLGITSILSLVAFSVHKATSISLIRNIYVGIYPILARFRIAYIFEILSIIMIIGILFLTPFAYKDSNVFSFRKPAFYLAVLGLSSLVISGFMANSLFASIYNESISITFIEFQSQYTTGAIFSQLATFLLLLSLSFWVFSIARSNGWIALAISIFTMVIITLFAFLDLLLLLRYNLSELYPSMIVYKSFIKQHYAFYYIYFIFIIFNIFYGLTLCLGDFTVERKTTEKVFTKGVTVAGRVEKATPSKPYKLAKEEVIATPAESEQRQPLQPIVAYLCPICQEKIEKDSQFCRHCGSHLEHDSSRRRTT